MSCLNNIVIKGSTWSGWKCSARRVASFFLLRIRFFFSCTFAWQKNIETFPLAGPFSFSHSDLHVFGGCQAHLRFFHHSHPFHSQMSINYMNWQKSQSQYGQQVQKGLSCSQKNRNRERESALFILLFLFLLLFLCASAGSALTTRKWNEIIEVNGMKLSSYSITKIGSNWLCKLYCHNPEIYGHCSAHPRLWPIALLSFRVQAISSARKNVHTNYVAKRISEIVCAHRCIIYLFQWSCRGKKTHTLLVAQEGEREHE